MTEPDGLANRDVAVSIVIPLLNEADSLAELYSHEAVKTVEVAHADETGFYVNG